MTRIPLSVAEESARSLKHRLELSTAEIGLSVRTTNCLEEKGIFTVRELLNSTPTDLLSIANFGEKTLDEVYRALEAIGFQRRQTKPAKNAGASWAMAANEINPIAARPCACPSALYTP